MEELETLEELEDVEELVTEGKASTDLLVRSSAGGVARVTILQPPIVAVSYLMPLMPFSELLFCAVRVSLRFSVTWTDHDMHRPKLLVRLIRSTALR